MAPRSRMRIVVWLCVAVLGLMLVSGCSTGGKPAREEGGTASVTPSATATPTAPTNVVKITSKGFQPAELRVKVRSRVTWVNEDKNPHNVAFSAQVKSGNIPPGQRASHIFGRIGRYEYQDALDPSLKGVIVVE